MIVAQWPHPSRICLERMRHGRFDDRPVAARTNCDLASTRAVDHSVNGRYASNLVLSLRKYSEMMYGSRLTEITSLNQHRCNRPCYLEACEGPARGNEAISGLVPATAAACRLICVDEKTAINARDCLDPVLSLSPGQAERRGFEYHRHGTLSLYAALGVKTGKVQVRRRSDTPATSSSPSSRFTQRARWARAHKTKAVEQAEAHWRT
jgi:hypothetical protein